MQPNSYSGAETSRLLLLIRSGQPGYPTELLLKVESTGCFAPVRLAAGCGREGEVGNGGLGTFYFAEPGFG
jgi:hypothetical protein